MKKFTGAETKLECEVQKILNRRIESPDYDAQGVINDLMYGGCQSGFIGELVYYPDALAFFKRHREEIGVLLGDVLEYSDYGPCGLFGANVWDRHDPLALGIINQNILAWFAFEETARNLAINMGLEV